MLDVLYKKARGYEVTETTREYGVDEEGNAKLLKEKTATKHVPPDLAALKAYLEMKEGELCAMSDEELRAERDRLLKELKTTEINAEKTEINDKTSGINDKTSGINDKTSDINAQTLKNRPKIEDSENKADCNDDRNAD